jgi:3-oxoacyl-[acyl-carrier protein] reductase
MTDTILVTGASSGIGRSIAEHFAGDYDVVAVARRIERMQELYADTGGVTPYELDLADAAGIEETLDRITATHGPILYLINNAGVNVSVPADDLEESDLLYPLRVNAVAPMLVLRELLPAMEHNDFGRVINVTSGAAIDCPEGAGPYSASKAALNVLTATAAAEHADSNIKINLMSPGPCQTEMAPDAPLEPSACHPTVEYLLSLDRGGPTGRFFWLGYEVPLFPDLGGLEWERGEGNEHLREVL